MEESIIQRNAKGKEFRELPLEGKEKEEERVGCLGVTFSSFKSQQCWCRREGEWRLKRDLMFYGGGNERFDVDLRGKAWVEWVVDGEMDFREKGESCRVRERERE